MADKTIRLYKFDGSGKLAFDWFKDKMFAIGRLKDLDNAHTSNLPNADSQTNAFIAANVKKNKDAWNYLMLALKVPPSYMI